MEYIALSFDRLERRASKLFLRVSTSGEERDLFFLILSPHTGYQRKWIVRIRDGARSSTIKLGIKNNLLKYHSGSSKAPENLPRDF